MTDGPQIDVSDMPPELADAIHLNIVIGAMSNARYDAGYAQALRDVMYEVVESMPHQNPATADWINDYIKIFAAERGIDLD